MKVIGGQAMAMIQTGNSCGVVSFFADNSKHCRLPWMRTIIELIAGQMEKYNMPEQKKYITEEELRELKEETERCFQRAEEAIERLAVNRAESDKRIEELQKKNEKTIAELSAASKRQRKSIGDLGNKFGRFAESLAKPSLERILEQQFDADYQGWLYHKEMRGVQDLEVDGWAKARNGSGAAYLVEVKSRFKPKHLRQVWRMVERFRQYKTDYRHRSVYPMLAVVEISDRHRELVWDSGVYLIDIADGVFRMGEVPANFKANGSHGTDGVRREVPHLHLVRSDGQGKRTAQ